MVVVYLRVQFEKDMIIASLGNLRYTHISTLPFGIILRWHLTHSNNILFFVSVQQFLVKTFEK